MEGKYVLLVSVASGCENGDVLYKLPGIRAAGQSCRATVTFHITLSSFERIPVEFLTGFRFACSRARRETY